MKSGSQSATLPESSLKLPHEKIALRAFSKWLARGCPEGAPDIDWYAALAELAAEHHQPSIDQRSIEEPPGNRHMLARKTVATVKPPTAWWAVYGKVDRDGFPDRFSEHPALAAIG
jgi:hypothetical protein